jgi:gamma-glutamylcyclotransferase (GGCT)/AIG2-like uncharacterized protein YtfP
MARGEDGGRWRSPGGISALAGVAGVAVALLAIFVNSGGATDDGAGPPQPTGPEHTYLFVYGTTMPGHLRYEFIQDFVAEATPDRVTGRLYDSGYGYPAARFGGGQGTIEGYLLRLRPDRISEARRTFTELEAGLFEAVPVETTAGVTATAYEWIGATDGLTRIEDGRWIGPEA